MSFVSSGYFDAYRPRTPAEQAALDAQNAAVVTGAGGGGAAVAAPPPAELAPAGTAPPPTQTYEYPTAGVQATGQYGTPELAPGYGEQIPIDPSYQAGPPPQPTYSPESSAYQATPPPPIPIGDLAPGRPDGWRLPADPGRGQIGAGGVQSDLNFALPNELTYSANVPTTNSLPRVNNPMDVITKHVLDPLGKNSADTNVFGVDVSRGLPTMPASAPGSVAPATRQASTPDSPLARTPTTPAPASGSGGQGGGASAPAVSGGEAGLDPVAVEAPFSAADFVGLNVEYQNGVVAVDAPRAARIAGAANAFAKKRQGRRGSRFAGFPFSMSREQFRTLLHASIDAGFREAGMTPPSSAALTEIPTRGAPRE